jgi:hypothetical protein
VTYAMEWGTVGSEEAETNRPAFWGLQRTPEVETPHPAAPPPPSISSNIGDAALHPLVLYPTKEHACDNLDPVCLRSSMRLFLCFTGGRGDEHRGRLTDHTLSRHGKT